MLVGRIPHQVLPPKHSPIPAHPRQGAGSGGGFRSAPSMRA